MSILSPIWRPFQNPGRLIIPYLLKESADENLIEAIETVLKGEYSLDSALSNEVVKCLMGSPGEDEISVMPPMEA